MTASVALVATRGRNLSWWCSRSRRVDLESTGGSMQDRAGGTDYGGVTKRQQETWATGDFHEVARQNVCMAEALCEAADPRATDRVLDVACGSGTVALVAARRYCEVTGIDYVPTLIDRAKARSAASGLEVDFRVADAQELPFDDDRFDVVLSVYGVYRVGIDLTPGPAGVVL